jgi:hypothetical protein
VLSLYVFHFLVFETKFPWMQFSATARTVGHLSKSTEVMKIVNNLMKAPELATTMQEFSKEMTKVITCTSYFLFEDLNYLVLITETNILLFLL